MIGKPSMKEITSINNQIIKDVVKLHQKKYRDELGLFIVEGDKSLQDILDNSIDIKYIFVIDINKVNFKLNNNFITVTEHVMKKIATTDSVPNVLTVAFKPIINISANNFSKIILLNEIKDSGNAGTIVRSAVAFGIDLIILFGDCCDFYSSKVIRSTAGNFFKIPILKLDDINQLKSLFSNHCFISTDLHKSSCSISDIKAINNYVFMFGSEANGLTTELSEISDKNFILDINNNVESLNLATSVSIILYEMSKN